MKAFRNVNPQNVNGAVQALQQNPNAAIVGGGSDLLGMVKERLITPDVLVNLRSIADLKSITVRVNARPSGSSRNLSATPAETRIGTLVSLDAISRDPGIRQNYRVLAEAAGQVGTPQIRNAGTIGGNVMQRPWCWYYRNGFKCYKNGGNTCFSINGENEFHAIFGGGPSFIVHPSDTAPALVALEARFKIAGPRGEREVAAADFFQPPSVNAAKENSLSNDEVLTEVILPAPVAGARSSYHKVLDREAWTHAVVSAAVVLNMDGAVCRSARIVLGGVAPIPWRVPQAEALLAGQRVTEALAARVAEKALEGARPLAKNGYKIPLTKAILKQTVAGLATA
jgi:xanthine dehydrogenase YagS FAD-binding subunit